MDDDSEVRAKLEAVEDEMRKLNEELKKHATHDGGMVAVTVSADHVSEFHKLLAQKRALLHELGRVEELAELDEAEEEMREIILARTVTQKIQ